jgi:uncharacterized OB-fold protein
MSTPAADTSVPMPTADSEAFWDGCRRGLLLIPQCRVCGELNWFPRAMCRRCSADDLEWVPMSGAGTIYSFSVVSRPPAPDLPDSYVLGLVDLAEGVRLMTHIVDCPAEAVQIGLPVTLRFEQLTDEISLPVFAPVASE